MVKVFSTEDDYQLTLIIEHIRSVNKEIINVVLNKKDLMSNNFDIDYMKSKFKPRFVKFNKQDSCEAVNKCLEKINKYKIKCLQ